MSDKETSEIAKVVNATKRQLESRDNWAWLWRFLAVVLLAGMFALLDSHNDGRYVKTDKYAVDENIRLLDVKRAAEELKNESERLREIETKRSADHDTLIEIKTIVTELKNRKSG